MVINIISSIPAYHSYICLYWYCHRCCPIYAFMKTLFIWSLKMCYFPFLNSGLIQTCISIFISIYYKCNHKFNMFRKFTISVFCQTVIYPASTVYLCEPLLRGHCKNWVFMNVFYILYMEPASEFTFLSQSLISYWP